MPTSTLVDYKIIRGAEDVAIQARDHLVKIAKAYWDKRGSSLGISVCVFPDCMRRAIVNAEIGRT